jgi:hypothetical protein
MGVADDRAGINLTFAQKRDGDCRWLCCNSPIQAFFEVVRAGLCFPGEPAITCAISRNRQNRRHHRQPAGRLTAPACALVNSSITSGLYWTNVMAQFGEN